MPSSNLYFIGLVPPEEIRKKVKRLKEEMRDRYGIMHALKAPAHITLQKTFRCGDNEEPMIVEALRRFASRQKPFNVTCSGYGCIARSVIYINVATPEPVRDLCQKMKSLLANQPEFDPTGMTNNQEPHMTIATRDLRPSIFNKAWPEFQARKFDESFEVKNMSLLKHNGTVWEILNDFSFDGVEQKLLANKPDVGTGALRVQVAL